MSFTENFENLSIDYLKLLSEKFPDISSACIEIINLKAILGLPKGTEHFLSDIHGEDEAFNHVLKNASGEIKQKIFAIFGKNISKNEIQSLATLIYYPKEKLKLIKKSIARTDDLNYWYEKTLLALIEICRQVSTKYTRSKVKKSMPEKFNYILTELLFENPDVSDKNIYYIEIIDSIINLNQADSFIIVTSRLIQRLSIDKLHIIGDIYDRGPGAEKIMDILLNHHNVDFQWGNHDILWIGAGTGSAACICNAVRIALRYGNTETIENGYGINLRPLATFALEAYGKEKINPQFKPRANPHNLSKNELNLFSLMHKAISIIQFKIEGTLAGLNPDYKMEDKDLLERIDFSDNTINLKGKTYKLNDCFFPTVNQDKPLELTIDEENVISLLIESFKTSIKLQDHVKLLIKKGSMYLKNNFNLLFHGCIPLNEKGDFASYSFEGVNLKGKNLLDYFDHKVRQAYYKKEDSNEDIHWFLWNGSASPLFGKNKMATFERYFITEKETHQEVKNSYFEHRNNYATCCMILNEFGLTGKDTHIINGHVPVKVCKGELPLKAEGKLIVIDGGFCQAYQKETGIAGYTLVFNSHGLKLVSHEPFTSSKEAITKEIDIHSTHQLIEWSDQRKLIKDTDTGEKLRGQINRLNILVQAYKKGIIKENN